MTRHSIRFAVFTLAVALCGCTVNEIDVTCPEGDGLVHIVMPAHPDGSQVKSTFTGGSGSDKYNIKFSASDQISVFEGRDIYTNWFGRCFSIPDGKCYSDGSADFEGSVTIVRDSYVALYPYQSNAICMTTHSGEDYTGNIIYPSVPSTQYAAAGNFDPEANLAVARSVTTDGSRYSMHFQNVCALIKFTIPEGRTAAKAVFRSNHARGQVSGRFKVDMPANSLSPISAGPDISGSYNYVTLLGTMEGGQDYYLNIIPATLPTGFSIEIYDSTDHIICQRSTNREVTFERNTIYNLQEIPTDTPTEWLGSGTSEDPFLIRSYPDLKLLVDRCCSEYASSYQSKHYMQTTDINCGGNIMQIGNLDHMFMGSYDGRGFCISHFTPGVTISSLPEEDVYVDGEPWKLHTNTYYCSLFGKIKDASLSNIVVEPDSLNQYFYPGDKECLNSYYVIGGLVGLAESSEKGNTYIINCSTRPGSCDINFNRKNWELSDVTTCSIGGLVGECYDCNLQMDHCTNNLNITAQRIDPHSTISNCIGGLIGRTDGNRFDSFNYIRYCRNNGNMTAYYFHEAVVEIGGILGMAYEDTWSEDRILRISCCVNKGNITAGTGNSPSHCGGIVGNNATDGNSSYDPYIYACLNKGNISANTSVYGNVYAGGITGRNYDNDTQITLCCNTGKISRNDKYAGISGLNGRCRGCYWLDSTLSCVGEGGDTSGCHSEDESISYTVFQSMIENYNSSIFGSTIWSKANWQDLTNFWIGVAPKAGDNTLDLRF